MQEAQRHSEASFEDFMAQCRQQEWAAAKREIFGMGSGSGPISIPRSPSALRSPGKLPTSFHTIMSSLMQIVIGFARAVSSPSPLSGHAMYWTAAEYEALPVLCAAHV